MERLREFWRMLRPQRPARPRSARRWSPGVDGLETRQLLSTVPPPAALLSVAPTDGKGLRVSYQVDDPEDLALGVYRSADDQLDPADRLVGIVRVDGTAGFHDETVEIDGGLPPVPARPYVLAVLNPDLDAGTAAPGTSGSYRTHSIAIIVHGGVQNKSWKNGPPWQLVMAKTLQREGYEVAIPFNWVSESHNPGAATRQGLRLEKAIREAAAAFPPGEPIDLHLIGHSEGAVVVTQSLRAMGPSPTPEIGAGYLRVTLLDPYAASNGVPGQNVSFNGPLGWVAEMFFDQYQSQADDPAVIVPGWVDGSEVFYQQTPASRDHGTNNHIYNLWGQVPVKGVAVYYDLTPASITHSGKTGMTAWYQRYIVPILGEGAPELAAATLTARFEGGRFTGKAEPGATVRLLAAPANDPNRLRLAGRTEADRDASWLIDRRFRPGRYRFIARSAPDPAPVGERIPAVSTATLGLVVIPRSIQNRSGRNTRR